MFEFSINTINPQEFWKLLKEANSYTHTNINTSSNDNFQPKNFMKHFQYEGDWKEPENKTHIEEIENFLSDLNNYKDNDITDKPITITEVKRVIKSLKVGKSCGPDLILNEIIKTSCPVIGKSVTILFNLIFSSGFYPETWLNSYIAPLFKGGDPLDPNNYRGISLLNGVAKIFSAVLNERVMIYMEDKFSKFQFGFRP
ncbi:unnamed protein product [Mytilus coruscus]|uniref:Reverse transcriptase domain-containing protein n=1 Tax=Mytilus coruscus TaxID=42192 RepID=A0A6J8ERG6_MYTCO|nr:unnamed protein product [Mytilus coruscus]